MSRRTPRDPRTDGRSHEDGRLDSDDRSLDDDRSPDHDRPDIEHASIPDSFVTTIRVERSTPDTYRATQHDTDVEGYGSSPHLAIVEFVRRAEESCFGHR